MNYKLVNKQTKEEHICSKVVIDGFDYYVIQITYVDKGELFYNTFDKIIQKSTNVQQAYWINKVIATNNPSIDLPKVVDEIAELVLCDQDYEVGLVDGYNKSQESHPFSEEDMIEFSLFYYKHQGKTLEYWGKDLFEIWKEQRIKTIYYN